MIQLTRLNGTKFTLNAELIEQVEKTPDTVITLMTAMEPMRRDKCRLITRLLLVWQKMPYTSGPDGAAVCYGSATVTQGSTLLTGRFWLCPRNSFRAGTSQQKASAPPIPRVVR